ncbi:MAG: VacB/RNase II family 3'-5' exoribonuclease [Endomicrobiales bacterium]|nr:VacB/RNase II family 3'-5' exoribonuclease [Endomicrobiales bacterium]
MKRKFNKNHGQDNFRGCGKKQRHDDLREGKVEHHGRFAFLVSQDQSYSDVFLRGPSLNLAMDGDIVVARTYKEFDGRFSGEIIEVLKHAKTTMVGVLKEFPHGWVIFPESGNSQMVQVNSFAPNIIPKNGILAVVEVSKWPTQTSGAAGVVTELLGDPNNLDVRITKLLRARAINEFFPKNVLEQSKLFPDKLTPELWAGREELFNIKIFTIDGADARDFDDAVSLEQLDGGLVRLGVHIADVAHYVKPGSAIDKEAYLRGTSVYLPDRVVPMLPESLSNGLCSLVPHQERLTMSVFMDIDLHGKVIHRRIANTVIHSVHRFTYDEVEEILNGKKPHALPSGLAEIINKMGELSSILYKHRVTRGALDFDLAEYKVETDKNGKPTRVVLRPRLKSNRLIEEFMLLANEAIATELMAAKYPFLHRRHDEPDPQKIKILAKTLGDMDLSAGHLIGAKSISKVLQDILRQAENHPLSEIINSLIVRSMKQAVYSPESLGHFGIATKAYAHFTSPIRRYPDLMAHRAIKAMLLKVKENHGALSLNEAGLHCSQRERTAAEAEYKAIDLMRAELFKEQIGVEMDAIVTNSIETGSFVFCEQNGAEGMLRYTTLKPGTKIRVVVDSVNIAEGKIDFRLAQKQQMPPQITIVEKTSRIKHPRKHGRSKRRK